MVNQEKDTWYSWVVCTGSFCGQALSVGFFFAYGTIYVTLIREFNISETQSAWIGSLAYSLCFLFGYLSSLLCKRIGPRTVTIIGGFIYCSGFIFSSFVTHYEMLFISYSLIVGFGASTAFFCSVLVLPLYFEKRLAFANGIVSAGSGFGGLIISPTLEFLLRKYGFRNAMRIFSLSSLLLVMAGISYNRNYKGQDTGQNSKLMDKSLLGNKAYLIWSTCLCVILFGYYIPYVHLVHLAEKIGVSSQNASYLLSFASVSQIAGKLFFGKLADNHRLNRLATYQCGLLVLSIAVTMCPISTHYTGLVIFSVVFGFFEGCFSSYIIIITSDCVKRHQTNAAFGMMYSASSIFSLIGPPAAGFLYTSTGSYLVAFVICGGNITLSILAMFLIPWFIPEDVYREKFLQKELIKKRLTNQVNYKEAELTHCCDHQQLIETIGNKVIEKTERNGLTKPLHNIFGSYARFTRAQREETNYSRHLFAIQSDFVIVDRVTSV